MSFSITFRLSIVTFKTLVKDGQYEVTGSKFPSKSIPMRRNSNKCNWFAYKSQLTKCSIFHNILEISIKTTNKNH